MFAQNVNIRGHIIEISHYKMHKIKIAGIKISLTYMAFYKQEKNNLGQAIINEKYWCIFL